MSSLRGAKMTSGRSTVTVVIPTYNRSAWLREALETTLGQTRKPDAVLVADNGSTDETDEVMAEFLADPVVSHLRRPSNIDPFINQNEALATVGTDYVALVPDDDRIYPDFIRATSEVLDREPSVGVVHTSFDLIDREGAVVVPDIDLVAPHGAALERGRDFVRRNMSDRWRVGIGLARTDSLRAVGFLALKDRADWLMADMLMWLEVAVTWDFVHLGSTLAAIRIHPDTLTATRLSFREQGYATSPETPDQYLALRGAFIERRRQDLDDPEKLLALAKRSWRLDRIDYVSQSTFPERRRAEVASQLWSAWRRDPRVAFEPAAWRLLGVSLAGTRVANRARKLKASRAKAAP